MTGPGPRSSPRVALACPGVDVVQRGYERFFRDLFDLLRPEMDITLFKGGGASGEREKRLAFLHRNGPVLRWLPIHRLVGRSTIHAECMTFALALLPHLRAGRFDVVHVIDPPLARVLFKLRRRLGLDFRLLFSHGCSLPPRHYPPADHVLEMGKDYYDAAIAEGFPPASLTLLPIGVFRGRFATPRTREELRREYGVPPGAFMVLSIAALDRRHKRTHHLIEEVARMQGEVLLWLDGSLDQGEPDLIQYARRLLGERCRVTHVAPDKVAELHRMADVFVHAATFEAFGLAIAEAALSGLPMLVHDDVHFHWMVANPRCWVDMKAPGALAARLEAARRDPAELAGLRSMEDARRRFDWLVLREAYRELYERVARLPRPRTDAPRANYFWELHA